MGTVQIPSVSATLHRLSTPLEIYAVCTSYQELARHVKLRSVANLRQCITSYSNRHHIYDTAIAFNQHRALTLNGQLHKRARPPAPLCLAQPSPPPSSSADPDADAANRFIYSEQLTVSMHACTLHIDKRMYTQKRWLCDMSIDLALHSFNKKQGLNGDVLFITSLLLQAANDVVATTTIGGRRLIDCGTLVKCVNLSGNHWIAVVWNRRRPAVVCVLDSMTMNAAGSYKQQLGPFMAMCRSLGSEAVHESGELDIELEMVEVAQQKDGSSCGLFVIEFCKVLAASNGDDDFSVGSEIRAQLLCTTVVDTREWLGKLSRTLDVSVRDPLFRRSRPVKRVRSVQHPEGNAPSWVDLTSDGPVATEGSESS